jgi:Glutathione S-transferase, N-terminal domain
MMAGLGLDSLERVRVLGAGSFLKRHGTRSMQVLDEVASRRLDESRRATQGGHCAPRMNARLYVGPASHPSMAAALMLGHKRIDYELVWLLLPFSGPMLRRLGFPRRTVPALQIDGRKIQGTREIARQAPHGELLAARTVAGMLGLDGPSARPPS